MPYSDFFWGISDDKREILLCFKTLFHLYFIWAPKPVYGYQKPSGYGTDITIILKKSYIYNSVFDALTSSVSITDLVLGFNGLIKLEQAFLLNITIFLVRCN